MTYKSLIWYKCTWHAWSLVAHDRNIVKRFMSRWPAETIPQDPTVSQPSLCTSFVVHHTWQSMVKLSYKPRPSYCPSLHFSHQHRATATNIGKQQACCGHFPHVRTTSSCMTYQVLSSPHQGSNLCDKASVDFPTSGQLPAVVICAMWPVLISQCQDNLQLS